MPKGRSELSDVGHAAPDIVFWPDPDLPQMFYCRGVGEPRKEVGLMTINREEKLRHVKSPRVDRFLRTKMAISCGSS